MAEKYGMNDETMKLYESMLGLNGESAEVRRETKRRIKEQITRDVRKLVAKPGASKGEVAGLVVEAEKLIKDKADEIVTGKKTRKLKGQN